MKRIKILFTFFILLWLTGYSQTKGSEISIGNEYIINSLILDQERKIQVYLPDSYESSDERYPTLYIVDGQWFFSNGVAIQKTLRTPDHLPEMIVIGIQNEKPSRLTLFYEEQDKYLAFIEDELIDFVDKTFRTNKKRVLFGWENGAIFSCVAFFDKSQLFDGAIISNGGNPDEKLIDDFNNLNLDQDKYLYIANSDKDIYTISYSEGFAAVLSKNQPKNVIWKYEKFNNEVHESLAYVAMYHGLIHYYHNYPSLVFSSIDEFNDLGGIPYLRTYFKNRSERFDFPKDIDDSTMNGLIFQTLNEDDIETFDLFMNEFSSVLSTPRYDSAYWQNRFAQFYLTHQQSKSAISYFTTGISKYPTSDLVPVMYLGLGDAYQIDENESQALTSYKAALKLTPDSKEIKEKIRLLKNKN